METYLEPSAPVSNERRRKRLPSWATASEAAVFALFAVFFIFYGVTPALGGDGLGLVGAYEPRYAQIAHEMLVRFDSGHTLKAKLGEDMEDYLILGACNPKFAHQAVNVDRQIGVLLPCNVVVRSDPDAPDTVIVAAMPKLRAAMHLDTVFTFADRDCVLVYPDIMNGVDTFSYRPSSKPARVEASNARS